MGAANRGGVLEDFSRQYPASKLNVGDEKEMNETNSKSSDELRSQAARAQLEVSELEREHGVAQASLSDAETVFNPALAVELRKRLGELPLYLNAARLKHAALRLEMFTALSAEHKAKMPELYEAMEAERPKLEAVQKAYDATVWAWRAEHESANVARLDANDARRQLQQLQSEAQAMQGVAQRRVRAA